MAGSKLGQVAAEGDVGSHGTGIADKGRGRIEITDHAAILGLLQVGEALRHRSPAQRVDIHEEAERAVMDREPAAVGILEACGDFVEAGRLVGRDDAFVARLDARGHAVIGDVRHRARLLGQKLAERLARVLVVMRHLDAELFVDGLQHRAPVGPLRRTVIANSVFGLSRQNGDHCHCSCKKHMFHGGDSCGSVARVTVSTAGKLPLLRRLCFPALAVRDCRPAGN